MNIYDVIDDVRRKRSIMLTKQILRDKVMEALKPQLSPQLYKMLNIGTATARSMYALFILQDLVNETCFNPERYRFYSFIQCGRV